MNYMWGKLGSNSLVGRLAEAGLDEIELNQGTPYAELWMGTHPNGPSMVMLTLPWRTVTPLSEWIRLNPSLLGTRRVNNSSSGLIRRGSMLRMRAKSLPFLFKILSVRTALSIQAHPDKKTAASLHVRQPSYYKDDNHKPEMAVAINGPFEVLCAFQPAHSILANLQATPELVALVGEAAVSALDDAAAARNNQTEGDQWSPGHMTRAREERDPGTLDADNATVRFKLALRSLFSALMMAPVDQVTKQLDALMCRIESTNATLRLPTDVLASRLHAQYPGDVGVFCVYLLNYRTLKPGEALYLGANEPHAYISGDCAEVMATSDNVVRAGLTPKWKDVETLCGMLTYIDGPPHMVQPVQPKGQPYVWVYAPPRNVDEFTLDRVEMETVGLVATLSSSSGLAIIIVVHGIASFEQLGETATKDENGIRHELAMGAVQLVCPHTVLKVRAVKTPLLVLRASAKPHPDLDGHTELQDGSDDDL